MKQHYYFVSILLLMLCSSSLFGQYTNGKKASLNTDGNIIIENILLPDDNEKSTTEMLTGFPFGSPANASFKNFRGAAIADIDEDGADEIIFGANNKLFVLKGNGEALWTKIVSGTIIYPPSIADMDGDGHLEIIVNTGGSPNAGRVYLLDKDGNDLEGWPQNFEEHWMFNAPAISDLDGDNIMEVITCERGNSTYGMLHVIKLDGSPYSDAWPLELPGNLAFTPSIGDIDHNGTKDIVISISSGSLYAINTNGSFLFGFPVVDANKSFSYQSPIIYDFDGDETMEIVGARHGDASDYYMVKSNGSYPFGWPITSPSGWRYSPPTVVDADDDGEYEIYVGHPNTDGGGAPLDVVFGYNAAGQMLDNLPINKAGGCEGVISVADVNNDDIMDLVFTSNITDADGYGFIHAYSLDGSGEVEGFPLRPKGFTFINSAVLGDIDGDELLDISCLSYTQFTGNDSIFITSYNLNVPYDESKILANGYKGNQLRDGNVNIQTNVGISKIQEDSFDFTVSPNPSNGLINLQLNQKMGNAKISIINYLGEIVFSTNTLGESNIKLDINNIKSGSYLIKIETDNMSKSQKWIKY